MNRLGAFMQVVEVGGGVIDIVDRLVSFESVTSVLRKAHPGDLLEIDRSAYSHYCLYLGQNGLVLDIDNNDDIGAREARTRVRSLRDVCGDSRVRVRNHDNVARGYFKLDPRPGFQIVEDAVEFFKDIVVPYQVAFRNCEYYCTLLRYGKGFSTQAARPTSTGFGALLRTATSLFPVGCVLNIAVWSVYESEMYENYSKLPDVSIVKYRKYL